VRPDDTPVTPPPRRRRQPLRRLLGWLASREGLNFWATNRVPRRALAVLVGRVSRSERPLVRDLSIGAWRLFADLDLADARALEFRSMHECFTRQLRPGARPPDPRAHVLASPSDGIVGACGGIEQGLLLQAKGSTYALEDLLAGDAELARCLEGGSYATLRLTSGMYHRFHAPHDCRVTRVTYVSGDAYNVNPAALARIPRLFCRNERAVLRCRLAGPDGGGGGGEEGDTVVLVPVAAILVASIRLHFLEVTLHLRYRGPNEMPCDAALGKGEEMGWFEHGSTIVVLAPAAFALAPGIASGRRVRAGEALMARRAGGGVTGGS